jgi:hypothetical protein
VTVARVDDVVDVDVDDDPQAARPEPRIRHRVTAGKIRIIGEFPRRPIP